MTSLTTTFSNNYGGRTPTWVYHNDALFRGGATYMWDTIALSTPFDYNGTDNLLVEIVWRGTASGLYAYAWCNTAAGNRRTYQYNISDTLVATGYSDYYFYNTRIGFRSVPNDVGVTAIVAPSGLFCICDTIRPVTVSVRNFGAANQTGVPVYIRVRDSIGGPVVYSGNTTCDVLAGQQVTVNFPRGPSEINPTGHNTRLYDTRAEPFPQLQFLQRLARPKCHLHINFEWHPQCGEPCDRWRPLDN